VQGAGCRVLNGRFEGLEIRVWSVRVQGLKFRVSDLGYRLQQALLRFGIQGLGFRV
jgi:hypothetical protein